MARRAEPGRYFHHHSDNSASRAKRRRSGFAPCRKLRDSRARICRTKFSRRKIAKDFEASYAILPSATAAEQLGEIAELKKDLKAAIQQYARAFALADGVSGSPGRHEIRQKLGNVWRLARGSDIGLGEYLLLTFDDLSQAGSAAKSRKNADAREPSEFTLRK